jgi:hypothetical protein
VVTGRGNTIHSIAAAHHTRTARLLKDTAARRAVIRWLIINQVRASSLAGKAAIFPALAKRIVAAWAIEQAVRETARLIEAAISGIAPAAPETAPVAISEIAQAVPEIDRA